jgi:hypothetical protein
MKIGRNDPCPCGSGRKYKQCCLSRESAVAPESDALAARRKAREWLQTRLGERRLGELTQDYLDVLLDYHSGHDVFARFVDRLDDVERATLQAGINDWVLCEARHERHGDATRGIDWALHAGDLPLTPPQRTYLEALAAAPLRLYEVVEVEPERGLHLRDLLQPDQPVPFVHEVAATRSAEPGLILGARLLALDGRHQLGGAVYPLSRLGALEILDNLEAPPHLPADADQHAQTPAARLPAAIRDTWLIDRMLPPESRAQPVPAQTFVEDRYEISDRAALESALAACPTMEPDDEGDGWSHWPEPDSDEPHYALRPPLDDDGKPMPGMLAVKALQQEVTDAARKHFEALAGAAVRFHERKTTHLDAFDAARVPQAGADDTDADRSAEARTAQAQQRYRDAYAGWADAPLPILGNRAPRALLADAAGRARVRLLLALYDETEAELARAARRGAASFDFLRAELGLG